MSKYLSRLNAIIQEKHLPNQVPKVPEAPFGTFGTGGGKHVCRNDGVKRDAFGTFGTPQGRRVSGIDGQPKPDEVELEERM